MWWIVPAAMILGAIALLLLRRRAEPRVDDRAEAEVRIAPAPLPPEPVLPQVEAPAAARPAVGTTVPSAATDPVEIVFEPIGLRLSLVYATLRYRVTLTAGPDLPAAQLLGDMIGAHASMAPEEQLAPPPELLGRLKPVPSLAAGESAILTGEVQLPLNAIRPLQKGHAAFFVPLVRLCLLPQHGAPALRRVYTVGVDGGGGGGLLPLRLDTGPREHADLSAREIEAARGYPVLPIDDRRAVG